MRCIEIKWPEHSHSAHAGLIETWDVLKYCNRRAASSRNTRLIETWDVLKLELVEQAAG